MLKQQSSQKQVKPEPPKAYWFILHRKSNKEEFFSGVPGDKAQSKLVREFLVKAGIPKERPTPLPALVGREYWLLIKKEESFENAETAPYFLTLNVPVGIDAPFGPEPYRECTDPQTGEAVQCNWQVPGAFGLHGVASDEARLAQENPGSSGCIRHKDTDITYLYQTLEPEKDEIRYYIEDN